MDGKDVIRELRSWSKIPIVVLSARDRESGKNRCARSRRRRLCQQAVRHRRTDGAAARGAAPRRRKAPASAAHRQVGDLDIDIAAHSVTRDGAPIKLTPKEFDLLAILARNAGRVVTHRQILTAVWGPAHTEDLQYLRVFIGQLRQKLEARRTSPS